MRVGVSKTRFSPSFPHAKLSKTKHLSAFLNCGSRGHFARELCQKDKVTPLRVIEQRTIDSLNIHAKYALEKIDELRRDKRFTEKHKAAEIAAYVAKAVEDTRRSARVNIDQLHKQVAAWQETMCKPGVPLSADEWEKIRFKHQVLSQGVTTMNSQEISQELNAAIDAGDKPTIWAFLESGDDWLRAKAQGAGERDEYSFNLNDSALYIRRIGSNATRSA